jgi:hypothetical protein
MRSAETGSDDIALDGLGIRELEAEEDSLRVPHFNRYVGILACDPVVTSLGIKSTSLFSIS